MKSPSVLGLPSSAIRAAIERAGMSCAPENCEPSLGMSKKRDRLPSSAEPIRAPRFSLRSVGSCSVSCAHLSASVLCASIRRRWAPVFSTFPSSAL